MIAPSCPAVPGSSSTADFRAAESRREARYDAILVRRFIAGDEAAFAEIVTRYRAKMLQVALGLLHNHADAEEIAQDTFIRAHRGLAKFRGDSSLASWLYRIALNLSRNRYWYYFRRQRHATLPLDAPFSDSSQASFAELVASDVPSPPHAVATSEFAAIITGCMNQLPAGQREILTLRNVQEHSYDHIGRTLGIRIGTVKSRIARARTSLRVLLGKAYPESLEDDSPFTLLEPVRSDGLLRVACA
ncbi:MAG: sigma-70 family RNA polymerase sigma factor [Opitutus sp.]